METGTRYFYVPLVLTLYSYDTNESVYLQEPIKMALSKFVLVPFRFKEQYKN